MVIEKEHIGQELIGPAQAADILDVGRANINYYLSRERVRIFRVGSGCMFFRSEVERAAEEIAKRLLQAHDEKAKKAQAPRLKNGMREGDIEVREVSPEKYISIWAVGASKGLSQGELWAFRRERGLKVYFYKGARYMLKSDLVKLSDIDADYDLN